MRIYLICGMRSVPVVSALQATLLANARVTVGTPPHVVAHPTPSVVTNDSSSHHTTDKDVFFDQRLPQPHRAFLLCTLLSGCTNVRNVHGSMPGGVRIAARQPTSRFGFEQDRGQSTKDEDQGVAVSDPAEFVGTSVPKKLSLVSTRICSLT